MSQMSPSMNPAETLAAAPGNDALSIDNLPVAYIELDRAGLIVRVNQAACELFQCETEGLIGNTAWQMMASEEIEASRKAFFDQLASEEDPPPIRRTMCSKNGIYRTLDMFRSLVLDAQGHPIGMRHIMIDVTASMMAHEEAHQARLWLRNVLASFSEAVIVTDALGFVRYMNPAAEQLSGWTINELKGKVIEKVMPLLSYVSTDIRLFEHRIALERPTKGIGMALTRNHEKMRIEISTAPIIDQKQGYTSGVVSIFRKVEDIFDEEL